MNHENETRGEHAAFPTQREQQTFGLTKREYFAAICLQGMLANSHEEIVKMPVSLERAAVDLADLLIAQLNKP